MRAYCNKAKMRGATKRFPNLKNQEEAPKFGLRNMLQTTPNISAYDLLVSDEQKRHRSFSERDVSTLNHNVPQDFSFPKKFSNGLFSHQTNGTVNREMGLARNASFCNHVPRSALEYLPSA